MLLNLNKIWRCTTFFIETKNRQKMSFIELERKKTEEKEILDKKRKLESLIYQSHIQNDKKRKRKKTLRKTHLLKKVLRK